MRMSFMVCFVGLLTGKAVWAQAGDKPWNGHRAAVVLTYDDAIDQHLDNAVPVLDSLGLKASFYITGFSSSVRSRMDEWRALAKEGHELGNHALWHPCNGGAGREWVKPDYDLTHYSVQRMVNELRMNNVFLQALDGKTARTFAFTCGDMTIGDTAFIDSMHTDFIAARAVRAQLHSIDSVSLYNIDCYYVNGQSAAQLEAWVQQARQKKALLVLLFHGVGGGNALNVTGPVHREFLHYLKQQPDCWVAPLIEVAGFVKQYQLNHKK